MKPIRLSAHAAEYRERRNFTEIEVQKAIEEGARESADRPRRFAATLNFPFNGVWNGKTYATKQVRAIFVEDEEEIVVITVFTYFF